MSKSILPVAHRQLTLLGLLIAALGITVLAGCGNDSASGALNPANDPKALDHNRVTSPDDLAKMHAYMKSHNNGPSTVPRSMPSVVK